MNKTLLEISDDLIDLAAQLEAAEGDVTDNAELIDRWLTAVGDRDTKLDNYAALIRECEARALTRKEEGKRMLELARLDQQKVDFLKERLRQFFIVHDLKTVHTRRYRLTHAGNGGLLPLLLDAAPEELPAAYRVEEVNYKANTEAIREALDGGAELDFARYGERGSSIRIK